MLKLKLADHPLLSLRGQLRAAQSLSFVAILFDEMPQRHVVNSSKRSLPRFAGYPSEARPIDTSPGSHGAVFRDQLMKKIGISFFSDCKLLETTELNSRTFVHLLGTCIRFNDVLIGRQLHCLITKFGFCSDAFVGSALIDMYSKCGFVREARLVFDDIRIRDLVLWNVMVSCYDLNGRGKEAFEIWDLMRSEGSVGDEFTFSSLLSSCRSLNSFYLGRQVHGLVIRLALDVDIVVGTALVDMYAKCGDVKDARRAFRVMENRNIVSWNTMIVGYGQCGEGKEAVKLLVQMLQGGLKPDELTLASVLSSCADMSAINEAIQIHDYVMKDGFEAFVSIGNALIMAYAKSGCIHNAFQSFCSISKPDLVTWSSMIYSYAFHGLARESIDIFGKMLHEGIRPDGIAFLGVLSACSHAGLVEEGLHYFDSMRKDYQIQPSSEHYTCLLDLLGRAGHINEAYDVLLNIPLEPDANILGAFIGACKVHGNVELAKWAGDMLFNIEPEESVNYMLMSNVYAAVGCWEEVARMRRMMRNCCGNKVPGYSWTEFGGTVHRFVSNDKSHLQALEIYIMLEGLIKFIKEEGNMPYDRNMDVGLRD
ncbi:pentatricopeptide repeat-containing protein At2g46050, mitochondrial isoform X1 [Elaeis guineensis]|uniref:pentatricopeptide repeat-containing protein At2g46050, mitochondrial isoform X1 n=1 Tax=Elaeis guineensis var. tenera TaxID=51953 RepID=UPI003C6CD587